ncbi:MAG: Gfo/Idh/MocA family oxidoreductase, partial [Olegusella sp.]|nr:Gfo/Idh/MocA family oxidoreductase [Olegusella sp.]
MEEEKKAVRWGILGAGNIAHRFAQSLSHVEGAELVALSCRSAEKAAAFAGEFGVERSGVFSDEALGAADAAHTALLADPEVDAVYLSLPHALHHDWAVRALRAGKAVLCEKPAML